MKPSFDRLTSLEDTLKALLDCCMPVRGSALPIGQALWRVAAEDIRSGHDLPRAAIALRDGFAIAAWETVGASGYAPAFAATVPKWVNCGDEIPKTTDSILPPHAVQEESRPIEILSQVSPGDFVRPAGGDLKAGAVIVKAGEFVRPVDLAFLRAAGIETVNVRAPRVLILVDRNLPVADLIGPSFMAWANALGATAEINAIGMHDAKLFGEALIAADADLTISVGGTGFGEGDCAAAALRFAGTLLVHGIAFMPAETTGFGIVQNARSDRSPVILVPGRVEAAVAVWLSLASHSLRQITGSKRGSPCEPLPLTRKIVSSPGISEIVLLRRSRVDDKPVWEPLAIGDVPWHALAAADAWHVVPQQSEGYPAGAFLCAQEI